MRKLKLMALAAVVLSAMAMGHVNAAADAGAAGHLHIEEPPLNAATASRLIKEIASFGNWIAHAKYSGGSHCDNLAATKILISTYKDHCRSLILRGFETGQLIAIRPFYESLKSSSDKLAGTEFVSFNSGKIITEILINPIRILIEEEIPRRLQVKIQDGSALIGGFLANYWEFCLTLEEGPTKADMLAHLRGAAEAKLREHGTLYRLLKASSREHEDDFWRSAAAQDAKAREVIGSFPEGDAIRTHLDAVWAEVSAVPAPVVPTEAELAVHRELIRRIIEE